MSAPGTPLGDPVSGRATPLAAPSPPGKVSMSSTGPSPASFSTQPVPQSPSVSTSGPPAVRPLVSLQPLPQGQPCKPKTGSSPPAALWQHDPPQLDSWTAPASAAPVVQLPPQSLPSQYRKPAPEAAYLRGGHLIGGFNPSRYPGVSIAQPKFNPDGRVLLLYGADSLQGWVQQISYIARSLSCFDELTQRFTSFPPPCTVELFICETRFATAFRVLEASISGQVWAYMRVLGYSSIPVAGEGIMSPTPADCFEYAKMAASKLTVPGTTEQPAEERKRMVHEILTAQASDYPGERVFKKGIQWLRLACDNLIRQGDYELAHSLYDPLPDWAPRTQGYGESGTYTAMNGEVATYEQSGGHHETRLADSAATSTEANHSPTSHGISAKPAVPNPPKLVPDGIKPGKRKRAKKDVGSQPGKLSVLPASTSPEL
ncbi:unnamed protein product [Discula destructiva]